jgi:predicted oxidoreductase
MTGDTFSKSSAELSPETLNADDVESFLLHHPDFLRAAKNC